MRAVTLLAMWFTVYANINKTWKKCHDMQLSCIDRLNNLLPILKANPDYKRLKQLPNLIISLDTEVSTPLQLSNIPHNPINDLIGY